MPRTCPISITADSHGLAGNLVLPDQASPESPVPGAVVLGGPGPLPLQRYSPQGAKQWPVLWTEALAAAGIAGLCYDQRGSGLSTGLYHEADWDALYDDALAAVEMLRAQPEVIQVAAIAWADGCHFALQMAAQGKVDALILLAPGFYTAEERYTQNIRSLASRRGLSERVVQLRVQQWRRSIEEALDLVKQGHCISTVQLGEGQQVQTNLVRFLTGIAFDPSLLLPHVKVPVLLLHGEQDAVIPPDESQMMAAHLPGPHDRITYRGINHFIYRYSGPMKDGAAWLSQVLV